MKKIKLLLAVALVGVAVALIYYCFEFAVHHSINYIWNTLLDTENKRLLIIPTGLVLTLIFFGLQHWLDRKSETHEAHGLGGETVVPTIKNFVTILLIGYFSLVAGASLGPEAVLVPACMVAGAFLGTKLFKNDSLAVKALTAAGIIALLASFFHSFVIGLLSVFLLKKVAKVAINAQVLIIAVIASAAAYFTLLIIDPLGTYFVWPDYNWKIKIVDLLIALVLIVFGYGSTYALKGSHALFEKVRARLNKSPWWGRATITSLVLSAFYLLGGPLVEFTGNESIEPMFNQAATLGVLGLIWLFVVKIFAIGWSKAMGFRGGLVFPMIFIASVLVAIATQFYADTNFMLALIGAMVGVLAAERKAKILF